MAPVLEHSGRGPVDGDMRGRVEATLATGDGHVNEHGHGSTGQTTAFSSSSRVVCGIWLASARQGADHARGHFPACGHEFE